MPSFSRIDVPVIDAHVSAWPSLDCCGCVLCDTVEGFGGALYDADGDKDLDLFLGANDGPGASAPCTYLNESEGAHAFSRSDCRDAAAGASTALGVDFDGDGVHELLTLGQRHAVLHLDEPIDLLEILPERDARRDCSAGAAAVVDLDLDGALDIYVGCQPQRLSPCCDDDSETWRNFALRQSGSGQFEQLRGEDWQLLEDTGVTLAIAIYDLNQDGLLDILLANDTFTMLGDPPNGFRPGGALLRCAPGEDCEYRRVEFGVGSDAWGSFMGVGIVEVDGEGPHVYLSDWGQNRLVKFGDDGPENSALDRGADLTAIEGAVLFGWGVVVDDFDRNGLDDIYVAQGAPWPGPPEEEVDQHDELLMQVAGGTFERLKAEEVGLVLHGPEDARSPESDIGVQRYSSRGSVRVDLDADGRMEFLTGALAGIVRVQEEDEAPDETPRCTVIPRPSVVPTMGTGYAVSGLAEGSGFRHYDIQGQMQFGASPWLLTRYTSGRVRFPSGAILPFDCDGGPGPVEVVEPEWLTVVWGDDVEVSIDRPGAPATTVRFAGRLRSGSVRFFEPEGADGVYTASVGGATQAVMVELDGKWVGRWFARP